MRTIKPSARRVAAVAVAGSALLLAGSDTGAAQPCIEVRGRYVERIAAGPQCTSPVDLCIEGEYSGSVTGTFFGTATALIPSADTPTTGVVLFTSDASINANVAGRAGTLIIKNSGAYQPAGTGDIVDLQTIVGGTGELSGATGAMRAEGTFVNGLGESAYHGTICLPEG